MEQDINRFKYLLGSSNGTVRKEKANRQTAYDARCRVLQHEKLNRSLCVTAKISRDHLILLIEGKKNIVLSRLVDLGNLMLYVVSITSQSCHFGKVNFFYISFQSVKWATT